MGERDVYGCIMVGSSLEMDGHKHYSSQSFHSKLPYTRIYRPIPSFDSNSIVKDESTCNV